MRMPRALLGLAGAGILGVGACSDAPAALPMSFDALVLDTLIEIGSESGAPFETFQGIWDIEADADGHLALLDLGGPVVHVFDIDGGHVSSLDAAGLEEGQLDRPSGIAWSEPGKLMVWDPGSSWVSTFDVGASIEFEGRWRAFAFGETGFCASGDRTFISFWLNDQVVHEWGPEGPVQSFGVAPRVVGADMLGPELREIAIEELTPSALLCTSDGVLDVSFVQSLVRLHDLNGEEVWSRNLEDFNPIVVYSDDGIGLGRGFDAVDGSHLLRSVVPWGASMVLVQHEIRLREIPEEGDVEVFESRLLRLADGGEVARTRDLPLVLGAEGRRLYLVSEEPYSRVTVVEVR